MARALALFASVVLTLLLTTTPARAGNYFVYLQGRGWASWNGEVAGVAGWTNVTLSYNGNAALSDASVQTLVKNTLATYCSSPNACVVHCYSAGCLRMLKAVYDLRAGGNTLAGLQYAEGSGSAAGGSHLAEISTQGLTGFIAKLLGQQETIDFDLTTGAARNTWGYVQNAFGTNFWQFGGNQDVCKSLLFFKICGNAFLPGTADGVVGMDSYSGASSPGAVSDGCAVAKYTWRHYDSGPYTDSSGNNLTPCSGAPRDHFGEPGLGTAMVAADHVGSGYDFKRSWSDATAATQTACSSTGCDQAFQKSAENFALTPTLTAVAVSVASSASNTTAHDTSGLTCYGKCGGSANDGAGHSCACDAACGGRGDCCGDYGAANCAAVVH